MSIPDYSVYRKNILVLYHASCTDGFGAAYAAWKKFGNTADYVPLERKSQVPNSSLFENKEVYILDYSFTKKLMLAYEQVAKKFVVVDHHRSDEEDVKSVTCHVFNLDYSAAYLAWKLFHPDVAMPKLFEYISDSDTSSHKLPDWEEIEAFIYSDTEHHFTFKHFTELEKILDDTTKDTYIKEVGKSLLSASAKKIQDYANVAELISFDGHQVYAVNAPREIKSKLGHELAKRTNSFALVFSYERGFWKCSLRSVGDFDVSKLAEKYGGGGHKNSAAFLISTNFPLLLACR